MVFNVYYLQIPRVRLLKQRTFKYTYRALFHAYWFKDLMPEFVLAAVVVVEDVVVEELGLGVVVGRDHLAAAAEAAGHRGRGLKKIIIRV